MSAPGNFCKSGLQGPLGRTHRAWPVRALALSVAALALALQAPGGQAQRISLTDLNTKLVTLEQRAAVLRAAGGISPGVIVMWNGDVDDIPAGWALCDGNNGTPNLRDRFIIGPYKDVGGPCADCNVNETSVSRHFHRDEHQHGNIHDHGLSNVTLSSAGAHNHPQLTGWPEGGEGSWPLIGARWDSWGFDEHVHNLEPSGGHSHVGLVTPGGEQATTFFGVPPLTAQPSTGTLIAEHLPPYYSLVFIMKLPG